MANLSVTTGGDPLPLIVPTPSNEIRTQRPLSSSSWNISLGECFSTAVADKSLDLLGDNRVRLVDTLKVREVEGMQKVEDMWIVEDTWMTGMKDMRDMVMELDMIVEGLSMEGIDKDWLRRVALMEQMV